MQLLFDGFEKVQAYWYCCERQLTQVKVKHDLFFVVDNSLISKDPQVPYLMRVITMLQKCNLVSSLQEIDEILFKLIGSYSVSKDLLIAKGNCPIWLGFIEI
jgi:hypothetical protein